MNKLVFITTVLLLIATHGLNFDNSLNTFINEHSGSTSGRMLSTEETETFRIVIDTDQTITQNVEGCLDEYNELCHTLQEKFSSSTGIDFCDADITPDDVNNSYHMYFYGTPGDSLTDTCILGFTFEVTEETFDQLEVVFNDYDYVVHVDLNEENVVLSSASDQCESLKSDTPWGIHQVRTDDISGDWKQKYDTPYNNFEGKDVRVYVLDSGFDIEWRTKDNEFYKVHPGKSFYGHTVHGPDEHGTHVAGTIASKSYGVAKNAEIVPVRVITGEGASAPADYILLGLQYAQSDCLGARDSGLIKGCVINMSIGTEQPRHIISWQKAIQSITNSGIPVVAAAGNYGQDAGFYSPSFIEEAIVVGAMNVKYKMASFSNHGPSVDIFAPGVKVLSTVLNGKTKLMPGTSMAAPHVAGILAIYISESDGNVTVKELEDRLIRESKYGIKGSRPDRTNTTRNYAVKFCAKTECEERRKYQACTAIKSENECLISNDTRDAYFLEPCVWCPNGSCEKNKPHRCEPKSWLDDLDYQVEYKTCLDVNRHEKINPDAKIINFNKEVGVHYGGDDISCGKFGNQAAIEYACFNNPECIGYSMVSGLNTRAIANNDGRKPWCLKKSADHKVTWDSSHDYYRKSPIIPGFEIYQSWTKGESARCKNLGCSDESGDVSTCGMKCTADNECNVFNFIPQGANGTRGTGRCCKRFCADTINIERTKEWKGWDIYRKIVHECPVNCKACNEMGSCTECNSGFTNDNGKCLACAERNRYRACPDITSANECLSTFDTRPSYQFEPCVWCPNGSCEQGKENRCEPKDYLDHVQNTGYTTCLDIHRPNENTSSYPGFETHIGKMCRGTNWSAAYKGIKNSSDCSTLCRNSSDCHAFDVNERGECYLHKTLVPVPENNSGVTCWIKEKEAKIINFNKEVGVHYEGDDISCGQFGNQAAIESACFNNPECIGYSMVSGLNTPAIANNDGRKPWCLKKSADNKVTWDSTHDYYRKSPIIPGFEIYQSWTKGEAARCKNLGCSTESDVSTCGMKCTGDHECNVFNFIPQGANGTSGTGRCCKRFCADRINIERTKEWRGWDIYRKIVHGESRRKF